MIWLSNSCLKIVQMTCFLMSEKTEELSYYKPQEYTFPRREERYFEQK